MIKKKWLIIFTIFFLIPMVLKRSAFCIDDIEVHGFASTGYINSEKYNYIFSTVNGSFEFSECGMNLTAQMNDNVRIGIQYYAYNMGEIGNNNVSLDWAFLDYRWRDALGIRVGKIKTPFGLYNEIRDYDMLTTSIFLPQGIYMRYYRDLLIAIQGVDVYGILSLGSVGRVAYDLFGGTFEMEPDSAFGILNEKILGWEFVSGEIDYIVGTRIKYYTPINGLLFGVNLITYAHESSYETDGIIHTADVPDANAQIYSTEYSNGNLTLAAEYHLHLFEATNEILNLKADTNIEAYYGKISYRFFDRLETGVYHSVYYWDKDNHKGSDKFFFLKPPPSYGWWQKDTAVSFRYDITNFWLVKFEFHYIDGTALAYPPEGDDYKGKEWTMFALKTTFNF